MFVPDKLNNEDVAVVSRVVLPSKYALPPIVLVEYAALGLNGEKRCTFVSPFTVIVNALLELSINLLDWQVNNFVFVTAVPTPDFCLHLLLK